MGLSKKTAVALLGFILSRSVAQVSTSDAKIDKLLRGAANKAQAGADITVWEPGEDAALEGFVGASKQTVVATLPEILDATKSQYVSVRGLAGLVLWAVSSRPDAQTLLSAETTTLATLLVDPNLPIRRLTGLAINNLHPNSDSPLVPVLETFLSREDAVSTVGPSVAGILMEAAPNRVDSTRAVVQFMKRQDHTIESRHDTLQSIQVARSHNHDIGKEVAAYADDPDEQLSVHAIEALQAMGKDIVLDNRQTLSRIAANTSRDPSVRAAATKALLAVQ